MTSLVYQIVGPTIRMTANATPGTANVTGVNTIKVDNTNDASVNVFFNYGLDSNTTASIANATSSGQGICIQHGSTEFVQLMNPNSGEPQTVYLAVAAASATNVFITPVAVVS